MSRLRQHCRNSKKKHRKEVERRRRSATRQRHVEGLRYKTRRRARYPRFTFNGHADLHRPTVEMDGEHRVVGLNPRWRTYAALGDVFGLYDCVNNEHCELPDGQQAFTFFGRCDDDMFMQYDYVRDVLGESRVVPDKASG